MATNNEVGVPLSGNSGSGKFVGSVGPNLTTPNIGVATATSLTFNPTTNGIIGTTSANNASSGFVGEFQFSSVTAASPVTMTSTVVINITSISLGAGDWDVWGNFYCGSTTATILTAWTNSVSVTQPDASLTGQLSIGVALTNSSFNVPYQRYSLASPTTIYLSAVATFSGTATGAGNIFARRPR